MELDRDFDDHGECNHEPKKTLNFNAPLLTTRRPANLATITLSSCPSVVRTRNSTSIDDHSRIPFSWEKEPGKPKHTHNKNDNDEDETPRPKLPPGMWPYHHTITTTTTTKNDNDIGCDADFDDDDNSINSDDVNKNDDVFSDGIDVFSLSEAIDIVERSQKSHETDGLRLKIIEDRLRNDEDQCHDFIIQRFLPDATALATASALSAMSLKKNNSNAYGSNYREAQNSSGSAKSTMSFSSPKGCGFKTLFPWSVKHRLCGVKSPVRRGGSHVFGGCTSEKRR